MEEGSRDALAEVQVRADRNGVETDRGGSGKREIDASGVQGSRDHGVKVTGRMPLWRDLLFVAGGADCDPARSEEHTSEPSHIQKSRMPSSA